MRSLPLFHRIAGKRVIVLGEGPLAEPKRRLVERAGGIAVDESDSMARLAFVALAEPEAAVARLKARGVLVNVVDRPELCDFTTPSILERDPVLVAVATSGASAGLAKQLRLRLEALLPHSLGTLATKLEGLRDAIRVRFPDPTERRQALDHALGSGGLLDPLDPNAAERADEWLKGARTGDGNRRAIILLTSDDPGDLTLRQAGLLGAADTILHEAGIPAAILAQARADAARLLLPFEGDLPEGLTVELRRG